LFQGSADTISNNNFKMKNKEVFLERDRKRKCFFRKCVKDDFMESEFIEDEFIEEVQIELSKSMKI